MCLYGSDIDTTTTPVEAALLWTISKFYIILSIYYELKCCCFTLKGRKRRDEKSFPGSSIILKQISEGVTRKRVGLVQKSPGAPVRSGAVIIDTNGNKIGAVTSGCPSPSLQQNIAMGYVNNKFAKIGTEVKSQIRGQQVSMIVTKMPFIKANYYIPPK